MTHDHTVIETGQMMVKMLIRQIRDLNRTITDYDKHIKDVFEEHPDAFIFQSFPGAGKQQVPRLLAAFGDDRSRYASAVNASAFMGVAPIT